MSKEIDASLAAWLRGETELTTEQAFTNAREYIGSLVDGSPREKQKKTAELFTWHFLERLGMRPFCCGGIGYLLPKKGLPIAITRDGQDFNRLLINMGIHPGAPIRDRMGKFIGSACYEFGMQTEAQVSFHYDTSKHAAYFAEGLGQLIKVTDEMITRVPNGTDGKLFLFDRAYVPWTLDLSALPLEIDFLPNPDALLHSLLFDVLEFENEYLKREDLHVLLNAYVATLFLPGIVAGKILLQVLGETGSAKTLFVRLLGRLIYGKHFEVTGLDTREEQFENALVNNSFLALDDVKRTSNAVILGMIRRACTGGSCKRRELYSTFGQVEEPYRAAIGITCSEEPFNSSDEMTNRSLVIYAKQRETFLDELELLKRIDNNRDRLMAEIMVHLQNVIRAVKAQSDFKPTSKMRMASFATFLLRIARQENWEARAEQILDLWREEQETAGLDPSIVEALKAWLTIPNWKTDHRNKHYGAHALYLHLSKASGGTPWWLGKENALVRALRRAKHAYHHHFGFDFNGRSSGHKPAEYWFEPSDELLEALGKMPRDSGPKVEESPITF